MKDILITKNESKYIKSLITDYIKLNDNNNNNNLYYEIIGTLKKECIKSIHINDLVMLIDSSIDKSKDNQFNIEVAIKEFLISKLTAHLI